MPAKQVEICSHAGQNLNLKFNFNIFPAGQWLNLRLQFVGCAVVTGTATIAVIQQHGGTTTGFAVLSPGLVGLAYVGMKF